MEVRLSEGRAESEEGIAREIDVVCCRGHEERMRVVILGSVDGEMDIEDWRYKVDGGVGMIGTVSHTLCPAARADVDAWIRWVRRDTATYLGSYIRHAISIFVVIGQRLGI